mmetsp:Transcript_79944/g.141166  ORF Transcript_79944/g.141166 Transcript_79944/m.141166 type:complete len:213 (-) Transcript_79944:146-784(-)
MHMPGCGFARFGCSFFFALARGWSRVGTHKRCCAIACSLAPFCRLGCCATTHGAQVFSGVRSIYPILPLGRKRSSHSWPAPGTPSSCTMGPGLYLSVRVPSPMGGLVAIQRTRGRIWVLLEGSVWTGMAGQLWCVKLPCPWQTVSEGSCEISFTFFQGPYEINPMQILPCAKFSLYDPRPPPLLYSQPLSTPSQTPPLCAIQDGFWREITCA